MRESEKKLKKRGKQRYREKNEQWKKHLKRWVLIRSLYSQAAGMGNWAQGGGGVAAVGGGASGPVLGPAAAPAPSPHLIPNPAEYPCPRCTRQGHSHEKCKSFDKLCRKCNNIGHFTEVRQDL